MLKPKACKTCNSPYHSAWYHNQRPPLQTHSQLKTTKAMSKRGNVAKQWTNTRNQWVKLNPPSHQGYYQCHICKRMVAATDMELDHVIARSRAPELRFELSNLKPSHSQCNRDKGSRSLDEL